MDSKFHLKPLEGTTDVSPSFVGMVMSLAAILGGGTVAALFWSSGAAVMVNNSIPFILGSALLITGTLFYILFRLIHKSIY